MALFRRSKDTSTRTNASTAEVAPAKEHGPWDRSEVVGPEGRLDLGALWVPGIEGMELRLELDQSNGSVVGASVVVGESALQLQAFAAPRTLGIWDDIRDEIVDAIGRSGGQAEVVDGPFGTQIAARLAQPGPTGQTVLAPVAFLGVDGPRWFLRGFLTGPAVTDAALAGPFLALFADTVVVRGTAAMAPRDLLPLRMPDHVDGGHQHDDEHQHDAPSNARDLNPLERGPEITEVH